MSSDELKRIAREYKGRVVKITLVCGTSGDFEIATEWDEEYECLNVHPVIDDAVGPLSFIESDKIASVTP